MRYQDTLAPGSMIAGEYRIQRVLGSGGFANTYLAHDLGLQRDVAVKEYFPREVAVRSAGASVSAKSGQHMKEYMWGLERFTREARIIARFRHPNIVRAFRVIDANETAYMVLEYVEGSDLSEGLKRRNAPPPQAEIDRLLHGLLQAFDVIHGANVLHRDVKPANIYIRAADGSPVLLDFGASKFDFGDRTGTTNAIVSRGYSAQESYATDSRLHGPWTDIYGLAATLYFALTGRAPPEATERVLRDEMTPAAMLPIQGYRPSFLAAVDWGLRIQPQHRPQQVRQWWPALLLDAASPPLPPDAAPYLGPRPASRPSGPPSAAAAASQRLPAASQPSQRVPASQHLPPAMPGRGVSQRLPASPQAQNVPPPLSMRRQHALTTHVPSQASATGIAPSLAVSQTFAPVHGHHAPPVRRTRWGLGLVAVLIAVGGLGLAGWHWGRHLLLGPGASTSSRPSQDRGRGGGWGDYSPPAYTSPSPSYIPPTAAPAPPPRPRAVESRGEGTRYPAEEAPRARPRRESEPSSSTARPPRPAASSSPPPVINLPQ